MAIIGEAQILIEPDDQYSTFVTSQDNVTGQKVMASTPAGNQTLAVAFDKAKVDLAALITGALKVKSVKITAVLE